MSKFQAGDVVWSEDGRKAEYVSAVGGEHAVRFAFRNPDFEDGDEEGEYFSHRLITIGKVFKAAPVEVIDARAVERQMHAAKIEDAIQSGRAELAAIDKERKNRMVSLQKHAELAQLEAWLDGKITHFVVCDFYSGRIQIQPWETALAKKSEFTGHSFGLLSLGLEVGWDKKLVWKRREQPRGDTLRPHTSLDDAMADASQLIELNFAAQIKKPELHRLSYLIQSARALNIAVPPELESFARRADVQDHRERVAKKQAELDVALAQLVAAESAA